MTIFRLTITALPYLPMVSLCTANPPVNTITKVIQITLVPCTSHIQPIARRQTILTTVIIMFVLPATTQNRHAKQQPMTITTMTMPALLSMKTHNTAICTGFTTINLQRIVLYCMTTLNTALRLENHTI